MQKDEAMIQMNNSTNNALTTPLSREEMAMYIAYLDTFRAQTDKLIREQSDVIATATSEMIARQEKYMSGIMASIDALCKTVSSLSIGLADVKAQTALPVAVSTESNADDGRTKSSKLKWVRKAVGEIASASERTGKPEVVIYRNVYSGMKKDGYDVKALFNDYKKKNPGHSKIRMFAESEDMVKSFEKQIKMIDKSDDTVPVNAVRSPESVRKLVGKLSPDGIPYGKHYYKARKLLENRGVLVSSIKADYCRSHGVKNVNAWFAVSEDEKAMKKLNDAINNYVEGKNV